MEQKTYNNNYIRNMTEISKDFNIEIPCKIPSLNSSYDKSLLQSPKLKANKMRPLSGKINDFHYIVKGTHLEKQLKRFNTEELNHILGKSLNKKAGNFNKYKKNIIKTYLGDKLTKIKNKNNRIMNNINKEEVKVSSNNNINRKFKKNLQLDIKDNNFEKNKFRIKNNFNHSNTNYNIKRKNTKKDAWMPKGYLNYEKAVLNPYPKETKKYNIKEIKQKSNSSDIFFFKPKSEKEYNKAEEYKFNSKSKFYENKLGSDIFNIKNDYNNLMKSSELFLFKKNNTPFNSESKSFWSSKVSYPTYMNHPSVEYNILNPSKKSNTKTKDIIYRECLEKNKNINPIYKQKSIGSYDDVTKVGINRNLTYNDFFNKENRIFYKQNNLCTSQYDLYQDYKNVVQKPFLTQINNNIYT